ncbi:MAG: hypothetical protein K6F00_07205 [Lachnospiraceae bacterium]|nr:hypothetical protein [Lachnospiraceae bacterium]
MNSMENSWHNVRGANSSELQRNSINAEKLYGDIIDLEHPISKKHPRLSRESRAAQFSPFAALTGLEKKMEETAANTRDAYLHDVEHVSFDELMTFVPPKEDLS